MKTTTLVWALVAVVAVLALGWWFFSAPSAAQAPSTNTTTNNNPNSPDYTPPTSDQGSSDTGAAANAAAAAMSTTVTLTANGFSPATVTIKEGGTVTFVNQGGGPMWVASDPHPTHEGYDGTTRSQHCAVGYSGPTPFDQCTTGDSYSFTFNSVGTWGYHNHMQHSDIGTITVVQ